MGSAIRTQKNILINHSDYNNISQEVYNINKTLEDLFHSKCDKSNCMEEYVFYSLFKNPNINGLKEQFQKLFFHKKKKSQEYRITFTQFCYFYFLFVKGDEIYETKIKFLAELFFDEKENIDPLLFINNMLNYCSNPNDVKLFFLPDFQKYIFKSKKQLFSKQKFIEYFLSKRQILKPINEQTPRCDSELIQLPSKTLQNKMQIYDKYNSKVEFERNSKCRPSFHSTYSSHISMLPEVNEEINTISNIYSDGLQVSQDYGMYQQYKEIFEKEPNLFEDLPEISEQLSTMLNHFFNLFRVKKIVYMSEQNNYFQEQYTYVCNCLDSDEFIGFNRVNERTLSEEHIIQLRKAFKEYEQAKSNKKIYIQDLKELFNEFYVHDKLINIICKYLERQNQSTIIEFETFSNLFKLFRGALYESIKKQLLFHLITDKKNDLLKISKIKDLFEPDTFIIIEKDFNPQITLTEFTQINSEYFIDGLFTSFEKINIIPFLKFNIIPTERAQFRECINSFGIDFNKYEEHLIEWCSKYEVFNAVPSSFINQINDYINLSINKVQKPTLDIQLIGKIRDNNKISLKYKMKNINDFYIIPSYIFDYLEKWFGVQKYSQQIQLNKIKLDGDVLSNEDTLKQIGYVYKKDRQSYLIQYSKIYCKIITFNELVENIKENRRQCGNEDNNVNIGAIYEAINEMMNIFRKPRKLQQKVNENEDNDNDNDNNIIPHKNNVIIELDWLTNEKSILKKVKIAKEEDIKKELASFKNIGNLKSSSNDFAFAKKTMKLYFYVHDEIREIKELLKGKMISDDIGPFREIIILIDYKKPGLIDKTYTYETIKEDQISERNYSFHSKSISHASESMMKSGLDSQKYSLDENSGLDMSIINPIRAGDFYTIITLNNVGNSCYINVILQIILNSVVFKEIFFNKRNCIEELIHKINKNESTITSMLLSMLDLKWNNKKVRSSIPRKVLEDFRNKCSNINNNIVTIDKEGDANEFFLLLLDIISSEQMLNVQSNFINYNLRQNQSHFINEAQCQRIGNVYWANHIKNEASYILPIFSMQTKTSLKCNKCGVSKYNFDICKCLYLSVEPKKQINLNICLRRLPFCYKVYYESISKEFKEFKTKYFPNKTLIYNLIAYYQQHIKANTNDIFINDYLPVEFTITIDKTQTIEYLISIITDIVELELEKKENEMFELNEINEEVMKSKETKMTSLLVWGWNQSPQFYFPEMTIQDCFDDEARVFIDEMLNVNGIRKVKECYLDSVQSENLVTCYSYYSSKNETNEINKAIKKMKEQEIKHKQNINNNNNNNIDNIIMSGNEIEQKDKKQENNNVDNYIKQKEEMIDTSSSQMNQKINEIKNLYEQKNKSMISDLIKNISDIKQENEVISKKDYMPLCKYSITNNIKDGYSTIKTDILENKLNSQIISIESLSIRNLSQFNADLDTFKRANVKYEYIIEIIHCYQYRLNQYFFEPFQKSKIQFKPSFIVLPSQTNESLTPIMLYDLIWEKYRKYLQALTEIKKEELWWSRANKYQENNSFYRFCYPFCIKIIKTADKNQPCTTCAFCYWYQFCSGCILNPFNVEPIQLNPNVVIEVEWCSEIVDKCYRKSDVSCGLKCLFREIQNERHLIPIQNDNNNNNNDLISQKKEGQNVDESLENLFNFYLKSEINENIKCENCISHNNGEGEITQQLSFYRLPEILVINFQRFLYGIEGKKINSFIEYPLRDLTLTETSTNKEIVFDLYGIINHLGSYSSGHYNCVIKTEDNKWVLFDDLVSEEVASKEELITQNAYILIYERRDSCLSQNSVFKLIEQLTQNINNNNDDNNKNFFEYEPVINGDKLFYFAGKKDDDMCFIGDEIGIYEKNLNEIQRCLFIKDEQDENDKRVRKERYSNKYNKNEGPVLKRTMSMFKENVTEKEIIGGKKSDACIIL